MDKESPEGALGDMGELEELLRELGEPEEPERGMEPEEYTRLATGAPIELEPFPLIQEISELPTAEAAVSTWRAFAAVMQQKESIQGVLGSRRGVRGDRLVVGREGTANEP